MTLIGLAAIAIGTVGCWWWQAYQIKSIKSLVLKNDRVLKGWPKIRGGEVSPPSEPEGWLGHLRGFSDEDNFPRSRGVLSSYAMANAAERQVSVSKIIFEVMPALPGGPYSTSLMQVEARGSYPQVKGWMGDMLARQPYSLALGTLELRATGAGDGLVSATVGFRVFERTEHP